MNEVGKKFFMVIMAVLIAMTFIGCKQPTDGGDDELKSYIPEKYNGTYFADKDEEFDYSITMVIASNKAMLTFDDEITEYDPLHYEIFIVENDILYIIYKISKNKQEDGHFIIDDNNEITGFIQSAYSMNARICRSIWLTNITL